MKQTNVGKLVGGLLLIFFGLGLVLFIIGIPMIIIGIVLVATCQEDAMPAVGVHMQTTTISRTPEYRVGDVVNGQRLVVTDDGRLVWRPLTERERLNMRISDMESNIFDA